MTTNKNSSSNKVFSTKFYLLVFGLILFSLTFFDAFHMPNSGKQLIPFSIIAIIAGVTFESIRLTEKWLNVLYTVIGSFIISFFFSIASAKEETYDFENHIENWPYVFMFVFTIISVFIHNKKLIPQLSEGTTLIQSIALIYWVLDYGFINNSNLFFTILIIAGSLFSVYPIYHSFSYAILSNKSRLILSIWSSFIMMFFALANIYSVYKKQSTGSESEMADYLYNGLIYFLLGVSTIYIVKNISMLIGFFPANGSFFNSKYFSEIEELKSEHIKRYSDKQVKIKHSFICVLFSGTVFFVNYYFDLLPSCVVIWLVFLIFPNILMIYDFITKNNNDK